MKGRIDSTVNFITVIVIIVLFFAAIVLIVVVNSTDSTIYLSENVVLVSDGTVIFNSSITKAEWIKFNVWLYSDSCTIKQIR